jgi:uncharacterized iron-regulated membrane protein
MVGLEARESRSGITRYRPFPAALEGNLLTRHRPSGRNLTALLVSQPLHFGDYGGMPMQVIWAVLDVMTIVVLGSGIYLWWGRRSARRRSDEIDDVMAAHTAQLDVATVKVAGR